MIKTDETAYLMVKKASQLFKQYYGEYPERIGLDLFTRMGEYADRYGEWYTANEPVLPLPVIDYNDPDWPNKTFVYDRVCIKIAPAVFEKVTIPPHARPIRRSDKGRNEVLCERDGKLVYMTIWFTEGGHHAIIWD